MARLVFIIMPTAHIKVYAFLPGTTAADFDAEINWHWVHCLTLPLALDMFNPLQFSQRPSESSLEQKVSSLPVPIHLMLLLRMVMLSYLLNLSIYTMRRGDGCSQLILVLGAHMSLLA
jgi:hypothetical protein